MAGSARKTKLQEPQRVIIEKVSPEIDGGLFPIKRTPGETVDVYASVFADGHEEVSAVLLYRSVDQPDWQKISMTFLGNDRWAGRFKISAYTPYIYTVQGYMAEFRSWRHDLEKKTAAGQDVAVDLQIGAEVVQQTAVRLKGDRRNVLEDYAAKMCDNSDTQTGTAAAMSEELFQIMEASPDPQKIAVYGKELRVNVERELARYSSWYEFFPRSKFLPGYGGGNLKESAGLLPEIARMGFNVVYLPPIFPIGAAHRKGKNNATQCEPGDPGCPWAIGSAEGGHKSVNPELGTVEDLESLIKEAAEYNIDVALDMAYQCSPDHPYVKEHPQWFKWRPDGTVQYAENPPKKYEDVLPVNFETDDRQALWQELKSIMLFWIDKGVRIFRVDNPHTKPFLFWDWLIAGIRRDHPDIIFLAEAFTRPHVMSRLAKGGFSQSYTYFTWRNTKQEFMEYMTELTRSETAEYLRPNFWPNTPDILPEQLQFGGRPAFLMRAVLAATLSSNWGIYGPAFELCEAAAIPNKEEYADSEKYEIKQWDWDRAGNLKDFIALLNRIRRENPALQFTRNIRFCEINNGQLLAYYKIDEHAANIMLVVVNLDPYHRQSGWLELPTHEFGVDPNRPYLAHDLLTNDKYIWQGTRAYVELDPHFTPAHIMRIRPHLRREKDFDYYM
ncbi:MAG: alpha-1,4-glucan--maltose-1-phosphate maltosyltransferase [Candidatus Omnitrophota bacterium]